MALEYLRARAELLAAVRRFFDKLGFLEVQTPVLSHDTMVDRYIDPIQVETVVGGETHRLFLQTSPEFGLKRLLCSGATAIYQVGPVFRGGECGPQHNPEFTMLEWYRVGDDYAAGMQLLDAFCQAVLQQPSARRTTYAEAFHAAVGLDPWAAAEKELAARLPAAAQATPETDRDNLCNLLWSCRVEPTLGQTRPEIVYDWPETQAALARIRPGSPALAERFELYLSGVELANGYHELTDPFEQQQRLQATNRLRIAEGKFPLPTENRLLVAMQDEGLPPCSGVAVGFDRLLMVRAAAPDVRAVLPFPFDRA